MSRQRPTAAAAAVEGEDTTASLAELPAPPGSRQEIELKLAIAPEQAARLGRHPLLRHAASGRPVTRSMYGIYYDTPGRDLQRIGASLRLRREGARWVQTLKGGGRAEGGLHARQELETRVSGPFLDHAILESALADQLDAATLAQLQPIFVTEFKRRIRRLVPAAGMAIELCTDTGQVTASDRSTPICELELELESGSALALLEFADALVQSVPVRLEAASKAARGYLLADHAVPRPAKAKAIALTGELTVTDAWRSIVFACIAQLQANESGTLAGEDPEYLHQSRVALRRLRSAFSVFRPAFPPEPMQALLDEIRWLDRALGPARDWDVFVTSTLPPLRNAFGEHAGLAHIAQHATTLRAQATDAAREALASTRYTRLLLQLIALFHREPWRTGDDAAAAAQRAAPLPAFAGDVLSRSYRKVRKRGRALEKQDTEGLHALRIAVKKLRYASEFFAALYENKAQRRFVKALAGVQEHLGAVNDAAGVESLCQRFDAGGGDEREGAGLLRGWAAANACAHRAPLAEAWKDWRDTDTFWE